MIGREEILVALAREGAPDLSADATASLDQAFAWWRDLGVDGESIYEIANVFGQNLMLVHGDDIVDDPATALASAFVVGFSTALQLKESRS